MAMSRDEKALNGAMVSLGASGLVAVSAGGKVVLSKAAAAAIAPKAAGFITAGLANAWGAAPVTAKVALVGGQAVVEGVAAAAEGTLLAAAAPYIAGAAIVGGLAYAGYQLYMYDKESSQVSLA